MFLAESKPACHPLAKSDSQMVVHVLQVAAERRRKAAAKPFSLADSAVAALELGPPAARSASASENGSVRGSSSGAAERGQQEHAQTQKANGVVPEPSHNSSPPKHIGKQLDHPGADMMKELDVEKTQTLDSHNEADEGNKDHNCNGFHDSANEKSSQQDDANPAKSMGPQQPAKGTKRSCSLSSSSAAAAAAPCAEPDRRMR